MRENEFEKQLKKMMEDFNLSPSDTIWEKLKQKLNKKDRRKIPFFFLLGVGLITGACFLYYSAEQHQQPSINTINKKTITRNNVDDNYAKNLSGLHTQNITVKKDKNSSPANNKINHIAYNKNRRSTEISSEKNAQHNFDVNRNYQKQKNDLAQSQPGTTNNFEQLYNTEITKNNMPVVLNNGLPYKDSIFAKPATSNNNSATTIQKNITDSSNKNLITTGATAASQKNINDNSKIPALKKIYNNYKTPKWQWGITAFYGKSDLVENLINTNKSAAQYLNSNPATSYDTAINNTHSFSSAGAYSLGAVVKKKIFKNGFLSTGLNFIHLSVTSDIGQTNYSALNVPNLNGSYYFINSYYQPGSLKKYTSTYNFIELPFLFQQDFYHSKQIAFSYNTGFSIRQLVSFNALIYDPGNNIYFSKDALLRKTQFQFTAGLNFEINTGKINSIFIGPQFTYSLSTLVKNTNSSSSHFINYGIQAGLLFHKK